MMGCERIIFMSSSLDPAASSAIIEKVCELLHQNYIFPDVAQKIGTHLRAQSISYKDIATVHELCRAITRDVQGISHDKHLRLWFDPQPLAQLETEEDLDKAFM